MTPFYLINLVFNCLSFNSYNKNNFKHYADYIVSLNGITTSLYEQNNNFSIKFQEPSMFGHKQIKNNDVVSYNTNERNDHVVLHWENIKTAAKTLKRVIKDFMVRNQWSFQIPKDSERHFERSHLVKFKVIVSKGSFKN